MESWRPRSPDTSSSDEDQVRDDHHDSGATTVKRSYECTFCKRGFTNAQALGGHMNIHRKDRAKAKQLISGTSSLNSNHYSNEDQYISMSTSHHHQYSSAAIPSQGASGYYPVLDQMNYQMYFQPNGSNPRIPYGYDHDDSSVGSRSQSLGMNQELWGANLSLRLEDDEFRRGVRSNDEVDLELRLGNGRFI
ncbi:unnamed protein product [Malus baccata var. baccata]|uniref:C2H2-type domain-containing protein n=1 Tax=Malus baccata TaxID=106549 RepID=A0A540KWJ9_MALBA|nr:hypothetical protein C1H46_035911 [Malus baccata]